MVFMGVASIIMHCSLIHITSSIMFINLIIMCLMVTYMEVIITIMHQGLGHQRIIL